MVGDDKVISVTTQEDNFKLHVARSELSTRMQELFMKYDVKDLNIQDPSIEEVIESIMRTGVSTP
jgi:ABC-type uncharacterized transport system ATPase subunit